MVRTIRDGDADYPQSLRDLGRERPHAFSVEGDFTPASPRVAIVGAREALGNVVEFVKRIAEAIGSSGGVVISGGAFGVDSAAHTGALDGRGRTWSVIGCGAPHLTPRDNRPLFTRILKQGGCIIRTREHGKPRAHHLDRNRILVALADVVVVAQGALKSGTLNSTTWGLKLARPMWILPGMPWHEKEFAGSWEVIHQRHEHVQVLSSERELLKAILGRPIVKPRKTPKGLTDDELKVLAALGNASKHPDDLALETGLPTPAVTTALLTLALGDVVVEGLAGLFQRKGPA